MGERVRNHRDLRVYRTAFQGAMSVYNVSKSFPRHERYSLTDQVRRSSRSVCANLAEAWKRRGYRSAFLAKLTDVEGEAAETEVWLEIAHACGYLPGPEFNRLTDCYEHIQAQLIRMKNAPEKWTAAPASSLVR